MFDIFDPEAHRWRDEAACASHPTEAFFPEGNAAPQVLAVCAGCPVRGDCLVSAAGFSPSWNHGVWGGTSSRQRRRVSASAIREAGPDHAVEVFEQLFSGQKQRAA